MAHKVTQRSKPPAAPAPASKPVAPQKPTSAPPTPWVVVSLPRNSSVSEELKKLGIAHTPELLALIALANNISDFRKLPIGMELKLPPLQALKSGELNEDLAAAGKHPVAMAVVENDRKMWAPRSRSAPAQVMPPTASTEIAAPAANTPVAERTPGIESTPVEPSTATPTTPALTSRQSLEQFTSKLWRDQKNVKSADDVLVRLVMSSKPIEMNADGYQPYMATLFELSNKRPAKSVSLVEGLPPAENSVGLYLSTGGREAAIAEIAKQSRSDEQAAKLSPEQLKQQIVEAIDNQLVAGNLHFRRANVAEMPKESIFVNAVAASAPKVMEKVVREIVDDPNVFPGVISAKIAGAGVAGMSNQSIVIYTQDAASAEKVIQRLRRYQEEQPKAFGNEVPAMTTPIAPGLARAAEPAMTKEQPLGFTALRAELIFEALQTSAKKSLDEKAFLELINSAFTQHGIDPQNPDRNLKVAPAAAK
ncbi:MAG: hypothetical protein K1X64_23130 [Myxococcaceae bacterium]|nr:hypothetical protein [Myxococcaceae bacterium]